MKICLIQSSSEIDLIRNKLGFTPIIIPLSLESLVYCDLNRIEYLDPESIIEKDFYKKASYSCSESLTKINLDKFKFDFLKNEIRSIIRFRFNQIVFLIEIIENLKKKKKISEIFFKNKYSSIEYDVMTIYPGYNFANIESVLLNLYNDSKIKLL